MHMCELKPVYGQQLIPLYERLSRPDLSDIETNYYSDFGLIMFHNYTLLMLFTIIYEDRTVCIELVLGQMTPYVNLTFRRAVDLI